MITANEARTKTKECQKIISEQELAKIEELINTAIEHGKMEIDCPQIQKITREKLTDLGYKVEFKNFESGTCSSYTSISWE